MGQKEMQEAAIAGCPVHAGQPIDPFDPVQAADPYPWIRQSQREAPVFFHPEYNVWYVTRYEDVLDVLRDTETFSSTKVVKIAPEYVSAFPDEDPLDRVLVSLDPPVHTRLRKLAQKPFTPKLINAHEDAVRRLCHELVDAFVDDRRCDLVPQFSEKLPVLTLTHLLGVPRDLAPAFTQWAADRAAMHVRAPKMPPEQREAVVAHAVKFSRFLREFVEERRESPREDLVSGWVHATTDEGTPALTTSEIVNLMATILSAGKGTTAILIANMVWVLLRHPDQWERVKTNPALVPKAVEETLRYRSSVHQVVRTATRDTTVAGVSIPAGADLLLHYGGAQRDESVFEDPDVFDIEREDVRKHFAFGKWTHICLGAPVARLEARVALETFIQRIPDMRFAEDYEEAWVGGFQAPALTSLRLEW